jgi:hypothetical protein
LFTGHKNQRVFVRGVTWENRLDGFTEFLEGNF